MFKYLSGFKVTFLIVIFYSKMSANNNSQRKEGDSYRTTSIFACRICRKTHALKYCWRFRNMNTTQRMEAVKKYGYCPNCLAHSHSQGSCFTTTGCGYCQKRHHSLFRPVKGVGSHQHKSRQYAQRKIPGLLHSRQYLPT